MGIKLAAFRTVDDSRGNDLVGDIVPVRKSKRFASHLKGDTHDSDGIGI
jgi:hypothetical protein